MYNVWGKGEVHIGFWWENFKEGDHFDNSGVDGRIIQSNP
jgi:hypothetical protein